MKYKTFTMCQWLFWNLYILSLTNPPNMGFPGGSDGKEYACSAGDLGSIPGSGRSPGEGNGNPLQYSCLENSMDRGAQQPIVHGITKESYMTLVTKQQQQTIAMVVGCFCGLDDGLQNIKIRSRLYMEVDTMKNRT